MSNHGKQERDSKRNTVSPNQLQIEINTLDGLSTPTFDHGYISGSMALEQLKITHLRNTLAAHFKSSGHGYASNGFLV